MSIFLPVVEFQLLVLTFAVYDGFSCCRCSKSTFVITFPEDELDEDETHTYISIFPIYYPWAIETLTLCYWARPKGWDGTPFTYNFEPGVKENVILSQFDVDDEQFHTGVKACFRYKNEEVCAREPSNDSPSNKWFHACFTWSSITGKQNGYINGNGYNEVSFGEDEQPLSPEGNFILSYDMFQDTSFAGDLTEVHMWDHLLSSEEVSAIANCTYLEEGNILSWGNSNMDFYGNIELTAAPFPCTED